MLSRSTEFARIHWVNAPPFEDQALPSDEEREQMLMILREQKDLDLQWGDLVANINVNPERNDGLTIFDGKELLDFEADVDDYGALPSQFRVLEPHPETGKIIPINYWHDFHGVSDKIGKFNGVKRFTFVDHCAYLKEKRDADADPDDDTVPTEFFPYSRFISHNNIVWIDHNKSHSEEYKRNLSYGWCPLDRTKKAIWTSFTPVHETEDMLLVMDVSSSELLKDTENPGKYMTMFLDHLVPPCSEIYVNINANEEDFEFSEFTRVLFVCPRD